MSSSSKTPRVMTVGAYNMDSLGDFLMLLVTERYLEDAETVLAAPFGADMRPLLDRKVSAFGHLLESERFDIIWTIGGGIEGLDLDFAYSMSATPEEYEAYERGTPSERRRVLTEGAGNAPVVHAFIPWPAQYPLNAGAVSVLNSAGIAHILGTQYLEVDPERREAIISLLRNTTFISVRDKESSLVLEDLGIEHILVPDVVHAIKHIRPGRWNPDSDYAIFQLKSGNVSKLGVQNVANTLANCTALDGLRIRILLSGTHRGIDSFPEKMELARRVREISPSIDIEVIEDRGPLDLVDHIMNAKVVIGDSHHVRVVASSYNVPRVSLNGGVPLPLDKVTRYMRLWDSAMPYDISLEELGQAVTTALDDATIAQGVEASNELTTLAHDNLVGLSGRVLELARTETDESKAERARQRRVGQAKATQDD